MWLRSVPGAPGWPERAKPHVWHPMSYVFGKPRENVRRVTGSPCSEHQLGAGTLPAPQMGQLLGVGARGLGWGHDGGGVQVTTTTTPSNVGEG